jgi:hypothetical protein
MVCESINWTAHCCSPCWSCGYQTRTRWPIVCQVSLKCDSNTDARTHARTHALALTHARTSIASVFYHGYSSSGQQQKFVNQHHILGSPGAANNSFAGQETRHALSNPMFITDFTRAPTFHCHEPVETTSRHSIMFLYDRFQYYIPLRSRLLPSAFPTEASCAGVFCHVYPRARFVTYILICSPQ